MKQAHLPSGAVFRSSQPGRTTLNRPSAQQLVTLAYALLITVNRNDSNDPGEDLTSRDWIPEARFGLAFEDGGPACEIYRGALVKVESGVNSGTRHSMTATGTGGSSSLSGIFSNHDWAHAAPSAHAIATSASAIHSAGANGGYT